MTSKETIIAAFVILECEPGCSEDEVKSSYRQLVKVWHPDRFETETELKHKATEKMKLINDAYQLLVRSFEQQRRKGEPAQQDAASNQSEPDEAEYKFKIDEISIRRFGPSDNGQFFFLKNIETIQGFDGIVLTTQTKSFHTKSIKAGDDFEFAAKHSMSFSLRPEQGVKSMWDFDGGIRYLMHPEDRAEQYTFPDSSWVMIWKTTASILENNVLDWCGRRSNLNDIKEDYQTFWNRQNWKQCVLFGQKAVDLHGQNAWGWIHRSCALHHLSMTQSALSTLKQVVKLFPNETSIFYNLACYSSQLGDVQGAKDSLKTLFKLARNNGTFERYHKLALDDSDLARIRSVIPQMALLSKVSRFF